MSLSPIKLEILETMLVNAKPMKAADIAKKVEKDFPPVMMHLLGLIRIKYAISPEKGKYTITEEGKKILGLPETTKEKAIEILSYVPHDKAFNFYTDYGKPLNLHAHNLRDFINKIQKVESKAIEFHIKRDDFETWFRSIGDLESVKIISLLKEKSISRDDLRKELQESILLRYQKLAQLAGESYTE